MSTEELVACVGQRLESTEVQAVLAKLAIDPAIRLAKGAIDARRDLHALGLTLVFRPEAPKTSQLIVEAVQFLGGGDGFDRFAGTLPGGLSFEDRQAQVRAKVGDPVYSDDELRNDVFEYRNLELFVNYREDASQGLSLVMVQVPFEDD